MPKYIVIIVLMVLNIVSIQCSSSKKQGRTGTSKETIGNYPSSFYGLKKMKLVREGSFSMGSTEGNSSEQPVHEVSVSSFYMDETPVTYEDFKKYVDAGGLVGAYWKYDSYNIAQQPVTGISWHHAVNFCNWRSVAEGFQPVYIASGTYDYWGFEIWKKDSTANGYRLPTEAEFEYAARGGLDQHNYPWGNYFSDTLANYDTEKGFFIEPWWRLALVKTQKQNAHGLYNMSGNCWQWCDDWYAADYYQTSSIRNPQGPQGNRTKVLRGGSWGSPSAEYLKVYKRSKSAPGNYNYDIGFRCVRSVSGPVQDSSVIPDVTKSQNFIWYSKDKDFKTVLEKPLMNFKSSEFRQRLGEYLEDYWSNSIYFQQAVDGQVKLTPRQLADTIVDACVKNNVNPLFLTGIMISESGLGTCSFPRWFNNPMAYFWQNKLMSAGAPTYDAIPNKGNRKFRTLKTGFDAFCKGIKNRVYYHKPAQQDLYAFHKVYVGYEAEEWMLTLSRVYRDVAAITLKPHEPATKVGALIFLDWK